MVNLYPCIILNSCVCPNYIGIDYQIHPVKDGNYGYKQSDGTWDGMVGELINKVSGSTAS